MTEFHETLYDLIYLTTVSISGYVASNGRVVSE
jgi:hypothetical protein